MPGYISINYKTVLQPYTSVIKTVFSTVIKMNSNLSDKEIYGTKMPLNT